MFTEDVAPFFNVADFAVEAVIDDTLRVNGIFDNGYQEALGMAGATPTFTCASKGVAGVQSGNARIVIGGAAYRINMIEPDGTGVSVLKLAAD